MHREDSRSAIVNPHPLESGSVNSGADTGRFDAAFHWRRGAAQAANAEHTPIPISASGAKRHGPATASSTLRATRQQPLRCNCHRTASSSNHTPRPRATANRKSVSRIRSHSGTLPCLSIQPQGQSHPASRQSTQRSKSAEFPWCNDDRLDFGVNPFPE